MKKTNSKNNEIANGVVTTKSPATIQCSTEFMSKHAGCGFTTTHNKLKKEYTICGGGLLDVSETNLSDGTTSRHMWMPHHSWQFLLKFNQRYLLLEQYSLNEDYMSMDKSEISICVSSNNGILEHLCISSEGHLTIRYIFTEEERTEEVTFPYQAVKPFYDQLYALVTRLIAEEEKMMIEEEEVFESHEEYEEYMVFCRDLYKPFSDDSYYEAWEKYCEGEIF